MTNPIRRLFWAAYAAVYDQLWDNALADLVSTAVIAALDGPTQVLEVGAGTGVITSRLVSAGLAVHACEPEPHMATRFAGKLPAVPLEQLRCDELCLPGRSRTVVAVNVLHMIDDPICAVKQLQAAAGPHGRVVIVTPDAGQTLRDVAAAQRGCGVSRAKVARFIAWHAALAPLTRAAGVAADPTRLQWVEDIDPGAVIGTSLRGPFRILVVTGRWSKAARTPVLPTARRGRYDDAHVDPPRGTPAVGVTFSALEPGGTDGV